MKWPFQRNAKRLDVRWSYSTQGVLWRLLPSSAGVFVGEDRDTERKTVSFFCVDCLSGNIRWENRVFDQTWWIGIEALQNDLVVLHEFASPSMPDHQRMYVADIHSGNLLWANPEFRFLFASNDSFVVSKDGYEKRAFFEVDMRTGSVKRELASPDVLVAGTGNEGGTQDAIQFAAAVQSIDELPGGASGILNREKLRGRAMVGCEFLQMGHFSITGYYEQKEAAINTSGSYRQHLLVVDDRSGSVCFRDVLCANASAPAPDTFFVRNDMLYAIRERRTLYAVSLRQEGVER